MPSLLFGILIFHLNKKRQITAKLKILTVKKRKVLGKLNKKEEREREKGKKRKDPIRVEVIRNLEKLVRNLKCYFCTNKFPFGAFNRAHGRMWALEGALEEKL